MKTTTSLAIIGLSGWALSAGLIAQSYHYNKAHPRIIQVPVVVMYQCPVVSPGGFSQAAVGESVLKKTIFQPKPAKNVSLEKIVADVHDTTKKNAVNDEQDCPARPQQGSYSLLQLEKLFAEQIEKYGEYSSLLKCPQFEALFADYLYLKDNGFNAHKIRVGSTDPRYINSYFKKVKDMVQTLPENYQTLASQLGFYLYTKESELAAVCSNSRAGGCYHPLYGIVMMLDSTPMRGVVHELAHALEDQLSSNEKQKTDRILAPLFTLVQDDLIKNRNGIGTSWKDNSYGSRYAFLSPHGASNAEEHIATYMEDILVHNGKRVRTLLQGEYQREVKLTLQLLEENGFLGSSKEAQQILSTLKLPRR